MPTTYGATLKTILQLTINDGNATNWGILGDLLKFGFPDLVLGSGDGAGNCDLLYTATVAALASGSNTDLDLLGGALVDVRGKSLVFNNVKMIVLYNRNAATGDNLRVGAAASNAWEGWTTAAGSTILCGPGGVVILANPQGQASIDSTHKVLRIHNNGSNAIAFDIGIVGSVS